MCVIALFFYRRSCGQITFLSTQSYTVLVWSESLSVVSNSLQSHGLYCPWNSPGQNIGVDSLSLLQGIFPTQGRPEPRSPALQVDSLPAEPQGKPKNTRGGSLSFLQWIFQTQESNWGLLHCRRILYQGSIREAHSAGIQRVEIKNSDMLFATREQKRINNKYLHMQCSQWI